MDAQPGTNGKYYTHFEVAMIVPVFLNEQTTYGTKGLTCPKVLVVDWNLNPDRTARSRPLTSTVNAIRIMTSKLRSCMESGTNTEERVMNLPERVSATWKNEANPSCCMHCIRDDYVLKAQSHKGKEERF